jgi:ribosome-binding ATPase YchF (GTP1/OBG family)
MRIALLGLPGAGKTTVFDAVADKPVHVPPGTFQTETHVQVVKVRDPRLEHCRDLFRPRKYTPAGLELWDPPGVPLGRDPRDVERRTRLLASLREADAYVLVARGFTTDRYPYERPAPDPVADVKALSDELVAADFLVTEGRIQKLEQNIQRRAKSADEDKLELAVLQKCAERLSSGRDLAGLQLDPTEEKRLRGFQLFGRKRFLLLHNGPGEPPPGLGEGAALRFEGRFSLDAQIEAEVAGMDEADRPAFLAEFGLEAPAADRFVREVYRAAGLLSFFTVGEDEVRAWTLALGGTAVDAAGRIHTDLARGFVRAEVYAYDDLAAAGGERELKAKGGVRLEGKDYVVRDGEIVHIRSAV